MELPRQRGKLYVISGPSGVGKGTICGKLIEEAGMKFSVSMTTRAPRDGEINGVHYFFVSHEDFEKNIEAGGFLEHARVYQNRYGTPKAPVMDMLEKGQDVLLDIEMQGALQVRENDPDAVLIYILPPSLKILRERLLGRGTETAEQVDLRLSGTLNELQYIEKYDYMVVNDDLEDAIKQVLSIVAAERSKIYVSAGELIKRYKED